jgi:transcriptional regulator with XRE-family HTH domain
MREYVDKLRQIKEEKGLTIADIAAQLNMAEQYVAMIMLGELVPRTDDLERIMDFVLDNV